MKNVLKKYYSVLGSRCYPMPTLSPPPLSSPPLSSSSLSSSPLTSLRFFSSKSSPSPSLLIQQDDDDEDNEEEKIELPTKYRSLKKKSRGMNVTNELTSCAEPASWLATSSSKRKPSFHVSTSNISPPSPASSFSHASILSSSSLTQPNTATRASADSVRIKEGTLPSLFEVHQKEGEKEGEERHYQQKVRSSIKRRMAESSSPCFGFHPEEWCKSYPIAINGTRQSPIDITSSGCKCIDTGTAGLLDLKYPDSIPGLTVKNTGHGWIVNIPPDVARNTCLSGGPLGEDKYVLEQFHCHWGSNCSCGSEHTVDGKSYAAELHLVHWNTSRFSSFSEAASQDKGLAVLGVFLDATGSEPNPDLSKVTDRMKDIKYKNSNVPLDGALVIQNLLPADKSFWTYEGSLTTPPLFESVTWLVLKNPIQVTEQEVAQFRELCFHEECECPPEGDVRVTANFRPTQPIHDRVVSFIG